MPQSKNEVTEHFRSMFILHQFFQIFRALRVPFKFVFNIEIEWATLRNI